MSLALRQSSPSHSSYPQARLEALKARKAQLDAELDQERRHPSVSDIYLTELKKRKLHLKEEIEALQRTT